MFGYKTAFVLLTYLWEIYGEIYDDMLAANIGSIRTLWSPHTPIEQLFRQLKTCMAFSTKVGDHITEDGTIFTGVSIIENNGLFPLDYKE